MRFSQQCQFVPGLMSGKIQPDIHALGGGQGQGIAYQRTLQQTTIGADDSERTVVAPAQPIKGCIGCIEQTQAVGAARDLAPIVR